MALLVRMDSRPSGVDALRQDQAVRVAEVGRIDQHGVADLVGREPKGQQWADDVRSSRDRDPSPGRQVEQPDVALVGDQEVAGMQDGTSGRPPNCFPEIKMRIIGGVRVGVRRLRGWPPVAL